jgi:hypothetical protein
MFSAAATGLAGGFKRCGIVVISEVPSSLW